MWKGHRVAVVIPAFNEATKIAAVLRTMPACVDHIVVVDDHSDDETHLRAREVSATETTGQEIGTRDLCLAATLDVVRHEQNRGVGAAIATGYARAYAANFDLVAVMAGDGQMAPEDLPALLDAVASGRADYAKGNRFAWPGGFAAMPFLRAAGNLLLSHATRLASGLPDLLDSQCGYTVANRRALALILSGPMFPRYGYPNALLTLLGQAGLRVMDVPVRPVYGPAWRSGLRIHRVVIPISRLLVGAIVRRIRAGLLRSLRGQNTNATRALGPEPVSKPWLDVSAS